MIDTTEAYRAAVTGTVRRTYIRAVVNIVSPSIAYGAPTGAEQATEYSKPEQLHNLNFDSEDNYQTLELNRWLLDGSTVPLPDDGADILRQVGYVGAALSDADGNFADTQIITQPFDGVEQLQACSVYFSSRLADGVAMDFVVEVMAGDTVLHSQTFIGNRASSVVITGFTADAPTGMRISITKWTLPYRRVRVIEMLPGLHEVWGNDMIAEFGVVQQANFTNLALPYGTCTLEIDNTDRRFEPRNKAGIFKSIEERQGIDAQIGVQLPDGTVEYKPIGRYYQFSGGWTTGSNDLTIKWDLVDIIGLLVDRIFIPPATLPTTLAGWAAAVVAQLGSNFNAMYEVDADHASDALTASNVEDVTGISCGDMIKHICLATGTWARASAKTGKLLIEPMREGGNALTLDNMDSDPITRANDDVGALIFTLADGSDTRIILAGNEPASNNSISISNPFIRTEDEARAAAAVILQYYGGNLIETVGRGDPSSEIGDLDTVELDKTTSAYGRRQSQSFLYTDGVLQSCQSVLIEVAT